MIGKSGFVRLTARRLRLRTGIIEDCVLCSASKVCRIDLERN